MGEVYRARDTRLDRTVAIKVVPAHLANLPDFRQRFEREARTISSLNHPHICALYDVGSHDGVDFLVMEYLEGETLADRLEKATRLPLEEVLQIGIEIADALDKAHRQGVVHRDLKPGNIMLARSGGSSGPAAAKLLDFGLAKQAQPAVSTPNSIMATSASPVTAQGTILGTLQYMAPEQLEGREADARSDIFAFGVVLYEMATGRRPFEGKSHVSLMAAIVDHDPPPISRLVPAAPPLLDHFLKCCLAKNPDRRWQHMGDALLQLRLIADGGGTAVVPVGAASPNRSRLAWAVAGLSAAIAIGIIAWSLLPPAAGAPPLKIQFDIATPASRQNNQFTLSPSGSRLVTSTSVDGNQLWMYSLDSATGNPIPGTESAAWPFWSPDERFVAFFAGGALKRVDLRGGPPQVITVAENGTGATWNSDDVIVFAPTLNGPLYRVPAGGGQAVQLTALDKSSGEAGHRHPMFLPDGRHFLYTAVAANANLSAVFVGSLDTSTRTRLVSTHYRAAFAKPDTLMFIRDSTLMAQRFDPRRATLVGDPYPIAQEVGIFAGNSAAGFSVADHGVLAFRTVGPDRVTSLRWFDRQGTSTPVTNVAAEYAHPALAPDGQRVAVGRVERPGGRMTSDVWTIDLERGAATRLTFDQAFDHMPVWSPDGTRVAFASGRSSTLDNIYQKLASGVVPEEVLVESNYSKVPLGFSADGNFLVYREVNPKTQGDLWVMPLSGDRKPFPVVQSPFVDSVGQFSPDGRWMAYQSDESGRDEIYLIPFPTATTRVQVSTAGGNRPRWRRDGKELFYISPVPNASVMAVDIDLNASGGPRVGLPKKLFEVEPLGLWDVAADGRRFLINLLRDPQSGLQNQPIRVRVNWQP